MKILIMGFTKVKYMPYMNFYLDALKNSGADVHVLYWNRDLKAEDLSAYSGNVFHEFKYYQEDDEAKIKKIRSFLKYRKFVRRVIKKEKFDFIIALHSLPAVLLYGVLKKKYNNRFIFDYRDYTYESFAPFKKIVAGLTKRSYATFVSSDAYRKFLPEEYSYKIYTSHNILFDSLNHRDERETHGVASDKIRIAFWGFIRHFELNKIIIKKISEDKRFELHYYGREQQTAVDLKKYVQELRADNVFFHGEYVPEDRYEFIRKTDIIHNIYFDTNTMSAMGNKFYDGLIFYLPQICMEGSFMADSAERLGIGLACSPYEDNFTDEIYNYFIGIDKNKFRENCDIALEKILDEYKTGVKIVTGCVVAEKLRHSFGEKYGK